MESIAYYDGETGSPQELKVPFNDRSHFFGDGVYDASMGANGRVFLLEDHLERFFSSAAMFDILIPLSREELGDLLTSLLARVSGDSQFVYWQVTRGFSGERSHAFSPQEPGKLWVLVNQEPMADPSRALKLVTVEDHRYEYCNAKTLNLLPAVMYAQAAACAGADEAVLHRDGVVTECAHSNVLMLSGGALVSHPNDEFILRGIAKTHLIDAAREAGVSVEERPFTVDELRAADEVIVTSSSNLCTFANELDGNPVGGRDQETLHRLQDIVYREYRDYCGL